MFKTKLKKGDQVIVTSGKHKGASGKLLSMVTAKNRCVIEGVALVKKHVKARSQEEQSKIITKESSVNLSNVAFFDQKNKQAVKLGYRFTEDGNKVRYNKKTGEEL